MIYVKAKDVAIDIQEGLLEGRYNLENLPAYYELGFPPGHKLALLLEMIFSKELMDSVFSQMMIDFRIEHQELLNEGRINKATWIEVLIWFRVGYVSILVVYHKVMKFGAKKSKAD